MRRFHGIYMKNFITVAGLLLLSFIVLGIAYSSLSYRFVVNEKRETMLQNAEETVKIVTAYNAELELDRLEMRIALTGISKFSGFHTMLCDSTGQIISCSDTDMFCSHMHKMISNEVINILHNTGEYNGITNLGGVYGENRYVVALNVPKAQTNQTACYVILSANIRSMTEVWRMFAEIFIYISCFVMLIAFSISIFMTKNQTSPINEMAQAAHKFARGDFSVRVSETNRQDEIGELADAFNVMADSLERSEKLRSEFVANVSHELKTPMTTITGFADGMIDGTIPPEKHTEYLQIISSESKRLSRLVRSMLDMSQIQSMDFAEIFKKSFDVCEIARLAILSLEKKIIDKGCDIDAHLPEESIITRGDQDAITQVIYNLIDNAIKFAKLESTIRLEIWKQEGKAYISVENVGETIPPDELPLIFDRFHKSDRSRSKDREGIGLGLYIVKKILDSHNEDVYVTSRDGITRFVFTLTRMTDVK